MTNDRMKRINHYRGHSLGIEGQLTRRGRERRVDKHRPEADELMHKNYGVPRAAMQTNTCANQAVTAGRRTNNIPAILCYEVRGTKFSLEYMC